MVIMKNLIELDSDVIAKNDVIESMIHRVHEQGRILDESVFKRAIEDRESEYSTAIGYLIAIPHGQSETVTEAFIGFTRLRHPISWGNESVQLIFMLGVPFKNQDTLHMTIIARLSMLLF